MVFLIDDMGVMDTSVPFLTDENGKPKRYPLNDYYRTPGMERLAKQGIGSINFMHERVFAHANFDHDRPKRRATSSH